MIVDRMGLRRDMLQIRPYLLVLVISLAVTVFGCGQSGDLYLPTDDPQRERAEKP